MRPVTRACDHAHMNKKRLLTELALWLAALVAAVVLTGFDGWRQGPSRLTPSASAAPAAILR
jgi:hypothetical protein